MHKKEPLVSIIIPTYNRKKVISRAIDSCLMQTYKNIEIIICDDHSTDGTTIYLKNKYKDISNIVFCCSSEGKKGANAARNAGIRIAQGCFVAFLDSDDYLLDDSIENRIKFMFDSNYEMVYGDICRQNKMKLVKYDDISKFNQRKYLMQELSLCTFDCIMVRRSIFSKIGYLDEKLKSWQDDDLVIRIGMKYKIFHCQKPVAVVVGSPNSIIKNKGNLYHGIRTIVKKNKKEIIQYASCIRYFYWKIRVLSSWATYKEQNEKNKLIQILYHLIFRITYNLIKNKFRHIYVI